MKKTIAVVVAALLILMIYRLCRTDDRGIAFKDFFPSGAAWYISISNGERLSREIREASWWRNRRRDRDIRPDWFNSAQTLSGWYSLTGEECAIAYYDERSLLPGVYLFASRMSGERNARRALAEWGIDDDEEPGTCRVHAFRISSVPGREFACARSGRFLYGCAAFRNASRILASCLQENDTVPPLLHSDVFKRVFPENGSGQGEWGIAGGIDLRRDAGKGMLHGLVKACIPLPGKHPGGWCERAFQAIGLTGGTVDLHREIEEIEAIGFSATGSGCIEGEITLLFSEGEASLSPSPHTGSVFGIAGKMPMDAAYVSAQRLPGKSRPGGRSPGLITEWLICSISRKIGIDPLHLSKWREGGEMCVYLEGVSAEGVIPEPEGVLILKGTHAATFLVELEQRIQAGEGRGERDEKKGCRARRSCKMDNSGGYPLLTCSNPLAGGEFSCAAAGEWIVIGSRKEITRRVMRGLVEGKGTLVDAPWYARLRFRKEKISRRVTYFSGTRVAACLDSLADWTGAVEALVRSTSVGEEIREEVHFRKFLSLAGEICKQVSHAGVASRYEKGMIRHSFIVDSAE